MRITALNQMQLKQEVLELLSNLKPGDIVKGRILEAADGAITVKTAGGQLLTATLLNNISLNKGSFVELLINNISDNTVFAELHSSETVKAMPYEVLSKQLSSMGVVVNEKTLEAAKNLIKYNLPVNPDNIAETVTTQKQSANLANTSGEGVLGLLISEKNLKNTSIDTLNRIVIASEPPVKALIKMNVEGLDDRILSAMPEAEHHIAVPAEKGLNNALNDPMGNITDLTGSNTDLSETTSEKTPVQLFEKTADVLNKLGIQADQEINKLITDTAKMLTGLKETNIESIAYLLSKKMDVTPKSLEQLAMNLHNNGKISQFVEELRLELEKVPGTELKEIKDIIKKVFLDPIQIESSEDVKESIKELLKLGSKLEAYLKSSGLEDGSLRDNLSNLKDNIDFLRTINEYNNYIQIPVTINQDRTTAEVYVYKDGNRKKQIDPDNVTVLIALDLKNLGHIESLVNINQKKVNLTFRTQDNLVDEIIRRNSNKLELALEARGYTLNPVKVIKLDEPFNLIKLEEALNTGLMNKLHFDMKV